MSLWRGVASSRTNFPSKSGTHQCSVERWMPQAKKRRWSPTRSEIHLWRDEQEDPCLELSLKASGSIALEMMYRGKAAGTAGAAVQISVQWRMSRLTRRHLSVDEHVEKRLGRKQILQAPSQSAIVELRTRPGQFFAWHLSEGGPGEIGHCRRHLACAPTGLFRPGAVDGTLRAP